MKVTVTIDLPGLSPEQAERYASVAILTGMDEVEARRTPVDTFVREHFGHAPGGRQTKMLEQVTALVMTAQAIRRSLRAGDAVKAHPEVDVPPAACDHAWHTLRLGEGTSSPLACPKCGEKELLAAGKP